MVLPGKGEVLVRFHWAGVNGGCETFRARREHAFATSSPDDVVLLGAEGAGEVVAVGPGARLQVGDAVAVNGAAAFAEYAIAAERMCTRVPDVCPEAAVLAVSGMTAAVALQGTAQIQPGEVVVVTAAAGGTGHIAVQLALRSGCRVVAVCGGERKAAALSALGAHLVIDHTQQDVGAALRAAFPGGVGVVYEGVGGALADTLVRHLAPGGRLLQVGYIAGYPHAQGYPAPHHPAAATSGGQVQELYGTRLTIPTCAELFWEGRVVELPGSRRIIGQVWPKDAKAILRCRRLLYEMHAKGELQVWVDRTHTFSGLESAADALDYMLQGSHVGKVVVQIPSPS